MRGWCTAAHSVVLPLMPLQAMQGSNMRLVHRRCLPLTWQRVRVLLCQEEQGPGGLYILYAHLPGACRNVVPATQQAHKAHTQAPHTRRPQEKNDSVSAGAAFLKVPEEES